MLVPKRQGMFNQYLSLLQYYRSECSKSLSCILKLNFSESPLIVLSNLVPNSAHSQILHEHHLSLLSRAAVDNFSSFPFSSGLLISSEDAVFLFTAYLLTYFTFNAVFESYL